MNVTTPVLTLSHINCYTRPQDGHSSVIVDVRITIMRVTSLSMLTICDVTVGAVQYVHMHCAQGSIAVSVHSAHTRATGFSNI
jgi:hypothetical protein